MSPATLKLVLWLVLGTGIGLLGWKVNDWRVRAAAAEAAVDQQAGQAEATGATADAASTGLQEAQVQQAITTASRAAARRALQEYLDANPDAAARLDEPVPDELRRIARERREARERGAPH